MSKNKEPTAQSCCTICSELFCISKTATVDEDILELLKFLNNNIKTSSIQDSVVCEVCLNKIIDAYNFKTLYIKRSKKTTDKNQDGSTCMNKYGRCYICRKHFKQQSTLHKLDLLYIQDLFCHSKEGLGKPSNPQICNACQLSLASFHAVMNLLATYCRNAESNDQLKDEKSECENKVTNIVEQNDQLNNEKSKCKNKDINIAECNDQLENKKNDCERDISAVEYNDQLKNEKSECKNVNMVECNNQLNNKKSECKKDIKTVECNKQLKNEKSECENKDINVVKHNDQLNIEKNEDTVNVKDETQTISSLIVNKQIKKEIIEDSEEIDPLLVDFEIKQEEVDLNIDCVERPEEIWIPTDQTEKEELIPFYPDRNIKIEPNLPSSAAIHDKKRKIFHCVVCRYQTKYEMCYIKHMVNHTGDIQTQSESSNSQNSENIQQTKNINVTFANNVCNFAAGLIHEKRLKCRFCEYTTNYNGFLRKHLQVHKKLNPFKCPYCDYQPLQKKCLLEHVKSHECPEEIKVFESPIFKSAPKSTSKIKKQTLTRKKHNIRRIFQCQYCQFQTKYKGNLKTHTLSHKNYHNPKEIKTFKCPVCHFQAENKKYLTLHMKTHEHPKAVSLVRCDICGFETKNKYYMKKHLLNHEKHMNICQICGHKTVHKSVHKEHVQLHALEENIKKIFTSTFETEYKSYLKKIV